MSGDGHDIKKDIAKYKTVYVGLLIMTVVTVAISYLHLAIALAIIIAIIVAIFKAGLVSGFFMHLVAEKKIIYGLLIMTVLLFLSMMLLIYIGQHNVYEGLKYVP